MMNNKYLKRLQRALDAYDTYGSIRKAAKELGIPRTTLHERCNAAIVEGLKPHTPVILDTERPDIDAELPSNVEIQKLRDENAELRRHLRDIHRNSIDAEKVREDIFGLLDQTPQPPEWLTPKETLQSGEAGVPCTIWSDWHCGEVVNRSEVNGINEYNFSIAHERIEQLLNHTEDICFNHMTNTDYPGIVVNILGDMVSGELHPELEVTDEGEVFLSILWVRDRLIAGLERFADKFGKVFVPWAFGNHGRVFDRKPRNKRYVYRNADWLIACLVERYFVEKGDTRIQFQITASGESLYKVYNHRYLGVHGDDLGVRGGDGIIGAIGPIMRGEIKTHTSNIQINRDYDTILMGHWHQRLILPRAIVNNTLKGYDEFARRTLRAKASLPSQNLWFTHPKRGIICHWEVFTDEAAHMDGCDDWVSWDDAASEGRTIQ